MRHFRRVTEGVDVSPMLAELEAAPDLWNEHRERTGEGSPHAEADDIWLRFFPRERLLTQDDYRAEGRCVFYPAWWRLPSLHRLAFDLMHALRCTEMGGVLITRIPPGGRVLLSDPFRGPSLRLLETMDAAGWSVAMSRWSVGEDDAPRPIGVYELTAPA